MQPRLPESDALVTDEIPGKQQDTPSFCGNLQHSVFVTLSLSLSFRVALERGGDFRETGKRG